MSIVIFILKYVIKWCVMLDYRDKTWNLHHIFTEFNLYSKEDLYEGWVFLFFFFFSIRFSVQKKKEKKNLILYAHWWVIMLRWWVKILILCLLMSDDIDQNIFDIYIYIYIYILWKDRELYYNEKKFSSSWVTPDSINEGFSTI